MEIMGQGEWLQVQELWEAQGTTNILSFIFCDCARNIWWSSKITCLSCIHLHRENARTITSLPVSPSSSPLRYGPAHNSCFLSPPHPAYQFIGQSGYNLSDFSGSSLRPNPRYTQDAWLDNSLLRVQTPGTPPRTRPLWDIVNSNIG